MGFWRSKSLRLSRSSFSSFTAPKAKASPEPDAREEVPENLVITSASTLQDAPLLNLPLEIVQQVTSYLDNSSAASFCLSSRYICYAVGREYLSKFLAAANSKFERRKNIEILERAFPSHWYCAWCDKFHRHDVQGGPKAFGKETKRDCSEFNSYLHDSWEYVLCYHHVRLAMNRSLWGSEYGIGLDAFTYKEQSTRKLGVGKLRAETHLQCEARIVSGHFLLHATFRIVAPSTMNLRSRRNVLIAAHMSNLPHIVVGHRDSHGPHTGVTKSIEDAFAKPSESSVQLCSVCATDYIVSCSTHYASLSDTMAPEPQTILQIEVWRDLGNGRNPFNTAWRAHGELGKGVEGFVGDLIRLTHMQPGEVKKAFESGSPMPQIAGARDNGPPAETGAPVPSAVEYLMSRGWTQQIIESRAQGSESSDVEEAEHQNSGSMSVRDQPSWGREDRGRAMERLGAVELRS